MPNLTTVTVDGVEILNVTPHPIRFQTVFSTETVEVPPSGWVVNAQSLELPIGLRGQASIVRTIFSFIPVVKAQLESFHAHNPETIIAGSLPAAQAYPGLVFAMTPAPGYERVTPDQKRMNPRKWITF